MYVQSNLSGYTQINMKNFNAGALASGDYVVTADNGTETTNYIDMGINSSTYNDAAFTIGSALDGYLYTTGGDLLIGTATANGYINFFTDGTLAANQRMVISSTGVTVAGKFYATEKHFRIQHPDPAKSDKHLIYSSLETPFNGVQLHGKGIIDYTMVSRVDLPDHIKYLIHNDNINIQITSYKRYANYFVNNIDIDNNYFEVSIKDYENGIYEYFWTLTGERKDIDKLKIEE